MLLLLTSCEQGGELAPDVVDESSEIKFSASISDTSSQTKAAQVSSAEQMASVGLYCAHTGSAYWDSGTSFSKMENKLFTYNSTTSEWEQDGDKVTWDYATLADRYSFCSYSPHSTLAGDNYIDPYIQDGELYVVYSPQSSASKQVDLLLAAPRTDIYPQVGGVVALEYDHALACLDFKAIGHSDYKVLFIAVKNVVSAGCARHTGSEIEWDASYSAMTASYSAGLIPTDEQSLDLSVAQSIIADDGYLMMIPQSLADVEVTIVTQLEGGTTEWSTFSLSTAAVSEWKPSTRYTYTFEIEDEQVIFNESNVVVTPWVDDAAHDLDAPVSSGVTIAPEYWIDFTSSETDDATLAEKIISNLEAGITDMVIVGDYNDFKGADVFGGGSNFDVDESVFLSTSITDVDGNVVGVTSLDFSAVENFPTTLPSYALAYDQDRTDQSLAEVILPATTTAIDKYAFYNNSVLVSIDLVGVESLGSSAFRDCTSLTEVDLSTVESLGSATFYGCTSLTEVDLSNVTSIGSYAFYGCSSLTSVGDFSPEITTIESYTFRGCTSLTEVALTSSVTSIGSYTFYNCKSLTDVGDVSNVSSLSSNAFQLCQDLKTLNFTTELTYIPYCAFNYCWDLVDVGDISNVYGAGDLAFYYCRSLESLNFTTTLTSIGNQLFRGCTNLSDFGDFSNITSIGYLTFYNCNELTDIYLPAVKSVSYNAFYELPDDANIYLTYPATVEDPIQILFFEGVPISGYVTAENWSEFNLILDANAVVDDADGNNTVVVTGSSTGVVYNYSTTYYSYTADDETTYTYTYTFNDIYTTDDNGVTLTPYVYATTDETP